MKLLATLTIVGALLCCSCSNNPISPEVDQYTLNPKDRATRDRFGDDPLYPILLTPLTDSGIVWIDINH